MDHQPLSPEQLAACTEALEHLTAHGEELDSMPEARRIAQGGGAGFAAIAPGPGEVAQRPEGVPADNQIPPPRPGSA